MMDPRDHALLLDMKDSIQRIRGYLSERERVDLDTDAMLFDAVIRQFEILGEAARSVSPATRASLPGIPWRAIIGMRNHLIHAYKAVDPDAIWRTVQEDLPRLLEMLVPEASE